MNGSIIRNGKSVDLILSFPLFPAGGSMGGIWKESKIKEKRFRMQESKEIVSVTVDKIEKDVMYSVGRLAASSS